MEFLSLKFLFLFLVGGFAGSLNAVVGGGSFVLFPTLLMMGYPPILANATATISLWSGTISSLYVYQKNMTLQAHPTLLRLLIIASVVGGGLGAIMMIYVHPDIFKKIIPFLLLFASCLLSFKNQLMSLFRKNKDTHFSAPTKSFFATLIGMYGGFFGAGMGIMFMAFLNFIGISKIREAIILRNVCTVLINTIATIVFIATDHYLIWESLIIGTGATLGGYYAAKLSYLLSEKCLRISVLCIAWGMTGFFLYETFI